MDIYNNLKNVDFFGNNNDGGFSFSCWIQFFDVEKNWQTVLNLDNHTGWSQPVWLGTVAKTGKICVHIGNNWSSGTDHNYNTSTSADCRMGRKISENTF